MSFWSDIRDNTLDSIGVTKDIRDELNPLINQVATMGGNAAPTGGYVPPNTQGVGGSTVFPQSLGFMNQKLLGLPAWLFVAVIIALVGLMFLKGRK